MKGELEEYCASTERVSKFYQFHLLCTNINFPCSIDVLMQTINLNSLIDSNFVLCVIQIVKWFIM
jgi:hypothetical protein